QSVDMLPRAALRASRVSHSPLHTRQTPLPTALRIRTYAERPRRPPPPPPRPAGRPATRPPPPPNRDFPSASGRARQTSPGTSVNDQTWKPKDGIKFAGAPAAALPSAANQVNQAEDAARTQTSIDGTRPQDASVRQAPLDDSTAPLEPIAQKIGTDEPVPGSARDRAWEAQAQAENTPPPPDSSAQPQQPLPDLRQGLPSTFDMEYGSGRARDSEQARHDRPSSQTDGIDITTTTPREDSGRTGDRSYDRSAYETSLDRRRAQMANWLYAGLLFTALTGAFYLARPFNAAREDVPSSLQLEDADGWTPGKLYARMRARLGNQMGYYTEPTFPKLLPEIPVEQRQPYTLVLSLEDLMIHSTWDRKNGYRTAKRPGIDYFIRYLSQYYELVLFTSVPLSMADPVIKKLDPYHFIMWPLGREATKYEGGEYVKDLSYLNRPLSKTLILDTKAGHVKNQPENAIILPKWSGEVGDERTGDLVRLIPFLENLAAMGTEDVRTVLKSFEGKDISTEFSRREQLAREQLAAQNAAESSRRPRHSLGSLTGALGLSGAGAGGMGGGMVLADGQSVASGYARGKTLSDQIREQGQKQYEAIEAQIREHGAQWLREEEEELKKAQEVQMRDMKKGAFGWFGGKKEGE
ncbi:mitochondrial inner membrane protein required for protein import, partial [Friedmanniomyces endolithicus]